MRAERIMMSLKIPLAGIVLLCFLQPGHAESAELRYIRIGEHRDYTRIVFEFRGKTVFEKPVVRDKGRFSVVFANTTTALPENIANETSKRVDAITFARKGSGLAANITLAFPYFKINAFSLAGPDRVVLDITQVSKPPQGLVFEERLQKKPAAKPEPEIAEKKVAETVRPPVEKAGKQVAKVSETPKRPEPPKIPSPAPQAKPLQAKPGPQPVSPPQLSPETVGARSVHTPPIGSEGQASGPFKKGGHLQIYLLVILLVLSMIIVGLLGVIIFRKRRLLPPQAVDRLDIGTDLDENMGDIDARIKNELKKIG